MVERLINDGRDDLVVKANTFLASLTRIDDDRMMKVLLSDRAINVEEYSVAEGKI